MTSQGKDCADGAAALSRLFGTPGFKALEPQTRTVLKDMARHRRYLRDEVIVHTGAAPNVVGCVVSGLLRMEKTLIDGQQQIVGLLGPGDLFGRLFDGPFPFAVEAAMDADLCLFPKRAFEDLVETSPDLERMLILAFLDETDSAREWLGLLANHRTVERVAGFLVFLCRRWIGPTEACAPGAGRLTVDIPISRHDMAMFLGTRTESVSRALHKLEDEGLIEIVTPYRIGIADIEALDTLSGHTIGEPRVRAILSNPQTGK